LASGPWTEARFALATPQTVATRRWIEYVDLLKGSATLDVDQIAEEIADAERDLNAKTPQKREALARAQLARARKRLAEARTQRATHRKDLHL
jgi:hypothetical protein